MIEKFQKAYLNRIDDRQWDREAWDPFGGPNCKSRDLVSDIELGPIVTSLYGLPDKIIIPDRKYLSEKKAWSYVDFSPFGEVGGIEYINNKDEKVKRNVLDQGYFDIHDGKYQGKEIGFLDLTPEDKKNSRKDYVFKNLVKISGGSKQWNGNGFRVNPTCFWDKFKKEPVYPFLCLSPIGYEPNREDMKSIYAMESVVDDAIDLLRINKMPRKAYSIFEERLKNNTLEEGIYNEIMNLKQNDFLNENVF
jgi:hypothetical protein